MAEPILKSYARIVWRKLKLVRLGLWLSRSAIYDLRRYVRWSHGTDTDRTAPKRRHALYKAYHGVEKGLSLSEPRANFGAAKVRQLMDQINETIDRDSPLQAAPALAALEAYQAFNAHHDVENPDIAAFLERWPSEPETGGTEDVTADQIRAAGGAAGREFFWSRHSVRQFSDRPVDIDLLREVVDIARKTPSVCNRQGPRVHVFDDAGEALSHQPGNRGFGHLAGRAMVVTADLQAFSGLGERHQAYVDGGMFAMSLLLGLHAKGLGACPLAWTTDAAHDQTTRLALGIPENEVIIMMIALGHLPDHFSVAKSHRMELETYLVHHPASTSRQN